MNSHWRAAILCATLLWHAGHASERDVFDIDTFLEPAELGISLDQLDTGDSKDTESFRYWLLSASYVSNYQDRSILTDRDIGVIGLQYGKHWSRYETGAKLSVFEREGGESSYRFQTYFGRYSLSDAPGFEGEKVTNRAFGSLVIDDANGRGPEYEVTLEAAVQLPFIAGDNARGRLSGSYRVKDGEDISRILWRSSIDIASWSRARINGGFVVGYERRDGHGRAVPLRGELMAEWSSKRGNLFQLVWAPARQFESRDFDETTNHEIALNFHLFLGSRFKH